MRFKLNNYQLILILIGMTCFIGGFMIGSLMQQKIFIQAGYEVARGLEGANVELNIDINESIMVDRMFEIIGEEGLEDG